MLRSSLITALGVLAVLCLLSVAIGTRALSPAEVLGALSGTPDSEAVDAIVWGSRIPRTVLGLLVGAALGLAGAVMQALTRNPLADPGLLGVTAGAAFGIVVAVAAAGVTSFYGHLGFAFAAALASGVVVYLLGGSGRGRATPVRLALAGVAVSALLTAVTSAVALTDPQALNRYRFWAAGSLAGTDPAVLWRLGPVLLAAGILALAGASALNSLSLGEDFATALGRRVGLVRLGGALSVTLLTAAAVAAAGPIVFVGLVAPHLARLITGPDHRWLLPFATVFGPILVLAADIVGRVAARPGEVGVGIVVALIGAPLFIALVRRRRLAEL